MVYLHAYYLQLRDCGLSVWIGAGHPLVSVCLSFTVWATELEVSHLLGKHLTTELQPPFSFYLSFGVRVSLS